MNKKAVLIGGCVMVFIGVAGAYFESSSNEREQASASLIGRPAQQGDFPTSVWLIGGIIMLTLASYEGFGGQPAASPEALAKAWEDGRQAGEADLMKRLKAERAARRSQTSSGSQKAPPTPPNDG